MKKKENGISTLSYVNESFMQDGDEKIDKETKNDIINPQKPFDPPIISFHKLVSLFFFF